MAELMSKPKFELSVTMTLDESELAALVHLASFDQIQVHNILCKHVSTSFGQDHTLSSGMRKLLESMRCQGSLILDKFRDMKREFEK